MNSNAFDLQILLLTFKSDEIVILRINSLFYYIHR